MENIFEKYMNDVVRSEYKNYFPTNTHNLNATNKKTEFYIDYGDGFSMSKYQFFLSGTFTRKNGEVYAAGSNVRLIHNFVPYLFSRIEIKKHNYLIDEVDFPGITSTVKSIVSYKTSDVNGLTNCAFLSDYKGDKNTFYVCGDLAHLGLGFFNDVNIPIYKGGFTISFIRADNDDAIYRWKSKKDDGTEDASSLTEEAKVEIKEFYIRVPLIEFKATSKIMLVKQLTDLKTITFHFRKWQCIQKPGITGTSLTFDVTNIYRNIENPTFVLVAFQKTNNDPQLQYSSSFDSLNVKNIRVKINDNVYPEELQNLDIQNGNYAIAYEMYKDFKRVYADDTDMLYDPSVFINNKCVYVIDTSKQYTNISNSKSNIILHVDFAETAPDKTVMYLVIVSHVTLKYDIINSVIKEDV